MTRKQVALLACVALWAGNEGLPQTSPHPVVWRGRVVAEVGGPVGPFSPEERAEAIVRRLENLLQEPSFTPDQVQAGPWETGWAVFAGDTPLLVVTHADAAGASQEPEKLAVAYAQAIAQALGEVRAVQSWEARLARWGWALAATAGVLLSLVALARLARRLEEAISVKTTAAAKGLTWRGLELLTAMQVGRLGSGLVHLVRFLLTILALYLYASVTLRLFPATRGLAARLTTAAIETARGLGSGLVSYLPNVVSIVIIIIATRLIMRFLRLAFDAVGSGTLVLPGVHPEWADTAGKIARFLVLLFAVVAVFPYIPGSDSAAFKGISVLLGVLVSLGASGAMGNLISGILLSYLRPFQVGDRIRIGETSGDVLEKGMLATKVRTTKNVLVVVPNSLILGQHIYNFSAYAREDGVIVHTTVTIGYDVPWTKVHELLLAAAQRCPLVLPNPSPFVLQTALNDSAVAYELNAFTRHVNQLQRVYSELHSAIQDVFNQAGVEIMSPHYLAVRDGNAPTIPEGYREERTQSGAYRVTLVPPAGNPQNTPRGGTP